MYTSLASCFLWLSVLLLLMPQITRQQTTTTTSRNSSITTSTAFCLTSLLVQEFLQFPSCSTFCSCVNIYTTANELNNKNDNNSSYFKRLFYFHWPANEIDPTNPSGTTWTTFLFGVSVTSATRSGCAKPLANDTSTAAQQNNQSVFTIQKIISLLGT